MYDLRAGVPLTNSDADSSGGTQFPAAGPTGVTGDRGRALQCGDRIGRYTIVSRIGSGASGEVYRAEEVASIRRIVALKCIRQGHFGVSLEAALHEARALERCSHSGIARVHDAGLIDAGSAYIAMELIEGPTLDRWVREQRPSLRERLKVFVTLCEAVGFAHGRGTLHRDIKPSNVVMRPDESGAMTPVLVDFGLAALQEVRAATEVSEEPPPSIQDHGGTFEQPHQGSPRSVRGIAPGTPELMAPELFQPGAVCDVHSEVYALGAVLFWLVAERPPFRRRRSAGERLEDLRARVQGEPHAALRVEDFPRDLTATWSQRKDLDAIVQRAMATDPAHRYRGVDKVADDVRAVVGGCAPDACGSSLLLRARRAVRRHRRVVAAFTGLVLVGSVIAWFAQSEHSAREESDALRAEQAETIVQLEAARATAEASAAVVGDSLRDILKELRSIASAKQQALILPRVIEVFTKVYGADDSRTNSQRLFLAEAQLMSRDYVASEASFRALEAVGLQQLPEHHPSIMRIRRGIVLSLDGQGRYEDAMSVLEGVLAQVPQLDSPCNTSMHPWALHIQMGNLLVAAGRAPEAVLQMEEGLRLARQCSGASGINAVQATVHLGEALLKAGRDTEGLAALDEGARIGLALENDPSQTLIGEAWARRAQCHAALHRLSQQAGAMPPTDRRALAEDMVEWMDRWCALTAPNAATLKPFAEAMEREGVVWTGPKG